MKGGTLMKFFWLKTGRKAALSIVMTAAILMIPAAFAPAGASAAAKAYTKTLVVTIDPGHGGSDGGARSSVSGKKIYEKNLNLSIAKYLKKHLQEYKGVKVYMTRNGDKYVSLDERAKIADAHGSDLFFSIHNNARGSAQSYSSGASALISKGQYHKELSNVETALGKRVLKNIESGTKIKNRGFLKRTCSMKYPNGKKADYYSIVRNGTKYGIPTILMEHSFMDSKSDAAKLDTAAKVSRLAKADAEAIAWYYGLSKKNGSGSYERAGNFVRFRSRYLMKKDGELYYVKANEKYHTGWKTYNGKKYYFQKNGKALRSTTKIIGGKKYTFGKNGSCKSK